MDKTGEIIKVSLPKDCNILKLANQKNNLTIWVEGSDKVMEDNHFVLLHTGDFLPTNPIEYLDTILFSNDAYVVHVYKLP